MADEGVIDVDDQHDNRVEVKTNEGDTNNEEENNATSRLRSIVWDHFPYVTDGKKAKCKHCKKAFNFWL